MCGVFLQMDLQSVSDLQILQVQKLLSRIVFFGRNYPCYFERGFCRGAVGKEVNEIKVGDEVMGVVPPQSL